MGAGHDHASPGTPAPRLAIATALLGGFFAVELTTALLIGSISLLADAGHILTDVAAAIAPQLWWLHDMAVIAEICIPLSVLIAIVRNVLALNQIGGDAQGMIIGLLLIGSLLVGNYWRSFEEAQSRSRALRETKG